MALAWKLGVQEQIKDVDSQGKVIEVMRIPVLFSDGSSIFVNVPVSMYSENRIRALVEARAEEHAAVANLAGETT